MRITVLILINTSIANGPLSYYKTVNRTLPLITSKKNLHHHLSNVSTAVREAFLEALYALMRQSSQNPYSHTHFTQIFQKVLELLTKSQVPELSGNESLHHLVRLQTAIIMVMTIDMTGPSKTLGLNRGSFFGIANGIAQELNLHINPTMTYTQNMIDSVEVVSRRAWWSLIVLDRWYAAGMAKPYQITDNASKLTPQDSQILGECFYHLAREYPYGLARNPFSDLFHRAFSCTRSYIYELLYGIINAGSCFNSGCRRIRPLS